MHRTTTTATLLVTVAVSALSGCVTVQRPPVAPPAAPSHASVPRPDGSAEPQVVQAPAREALELIDPSRRPKPAAHPPRHVPAAPSRPAQAPVPVPRSHPHPRPHPRPEPRHPHPHPRQPSADIPDVVKSVPKNTSDVCALGRKYGGWQPDSPQSVICGRTYGR